MEKTKTEKVVSIATQIYFNSITQEILPDIKNSTMGHITRSSHSPEEDIVLEKIAKEVALVFDKHIKMAQDKSLSLIEGITLKEEK